MSANKERGERECAREGGREKKEREREKESLFAVE